MSSIRAHFDGKVFVPVDHVDLPSGTAVEVHPVPASAKPLTPLQELVRIAEQLPDVPDWPPDGASEHEHYLYGAPKHHSE